MPKKTKRKVSAVVKATPTPEVMDVTIENPSVTTTPAATGAPRTYGRRTPSVVEFKPDYTYIKNDLKRVGALAGTFFVILIVLSFIIK